MCKAWDDHKKRGIQEGRCKRRGIQEGRCKRRDISFRSLHNKVNAKRNQQVNVIKLRILT